jgi:hypothetical protein
MAVADISIGIAHFISFLTPDREVYVEAPVKFIPKKADTALIINNHPAISIRLGHVMRSTPL